MHTTPACRTPSAGVRVFRMWRDEGYLRQMLGLVAGLYSSCVLAGSEPEQEFYLGEARWVEGWAWLGVLY